MGHAMPQVDYEAEYNNRARVPQHTGILDRWARDAAAYRQLARAETGVPYGTHEREKLDYFFPIGCENPAAIFIIIHGGYWQALDRHWISHFARGLNMRGFAAALPSYDLAPSAKLEEIVAQIHRACDAVWSRFHRPIVVCGHSAGAHLGATLMSYQGGHSIPCVRAGMLISGVFDLSPLVETSINKALGLNTNDARHLSPLYWTPSAVRVMTVVGSLESSEFKRQSRELTDVWGKAMTAQYHEVVGANHFDVIDGLSEPDSELVCSLVDLGRNAVL